MQFFDNIGGIFRGGRKARVFKIVDTGFKAEANFVGPVRMRDDG